VTAEAAPPLHRRTVDVALEARVRRWTIEESDAHATLIEVVTVPANEPTDTTGHAPIRVGYGGVMRVAVLAGAARDLERVLRRAVLASGAELVLLLRANDARSFTERASALREARPDLVLALVADRGEAGGIVDLIEALRFGCADLSPAPRVVVAGEPHAALRLKAAAVGFAVELLPDPRRPDGISAFAHRGREFRRGTDANVVLRDEALEELARLVAAHGSGTLVVDVSGGSTSLIRAGADGTMAAVHIAPLGSGVAADRTVRRAGLDGVRRWIPWSIDAPTMLERVFNRARWPDAVGADASALALEIALAHEAVSHALADAAAAGLADTMRDAPLTIVTGAAASFTRAAHTALVAIDGLASPKPTTLYRDTDDALVALGALAARIRATGGDPSAAVTDELARRLVPIAFVVPVTPGRRSKLRIDGVDHLDDELISGAFFSVPHRGEADVEVTGTPVKAHGGAGELGIIVDARGRPLALPPRDAERIPALVRWFAALDLAVISVA
jgi:hypothetical protein